MCFRQMGDIHFANACLLILRHWHNVLAISTTPRHLLVKFPNWPITSTPPLAMAYTRVSQPFWPATPMSRYWRFGDPQGLISIMIMVIILRFGLLCGILWFFPSHIENKYIFILTFALATLQVGKPWPTPMIFQGPKYGRHCIVTLQTLGANLQTNVCYSDTNSIISWLLLCFTMRTME